MHRRPPDWLYLDPKQPWDWQVGFLDSVFVTAPAAGSDWSYTPQGGRWERIELVHAKLVTSAVVANRQPLFIVQDQNNAELAALPPLVNQAATTTTRYTWWRGLGATVALLSGRTASPLGELILRPGWKIGTNTGAIDVGDQWSEISLVVTRYTEGDPLIVQERARGRRPEPLGEDQYDDDLAIETGTGRPDYYR